MYSIMKSRINGIREEVSDFLCQLIEIPSPSTGEKQVADMIHKKLEGLDYDDVYRDNAGNILGVIRGIEDEPTLVLNSHMDTVQISPEKWTYNPLKASFVNNRIYGAGSSDCKGGIAAQVYAGELLKRCLLPFKGNLIVALTVAEENGLSLGVKTLLHETIPELGLSPDYVILGEPTNLGLFYGHEGRVELDIKLEGNDPFTIDDDAKNIYNDLTENSTLDKRGKSTEMFFDKPVFDSSRGRRQAVIHVEKKLHAGENANEVTNWFKHEADLLLKTKKALAVEVMVTENEQKLFCGRKKMVKHITNSWQTDPFNPLMERARQALAAAKCTRNTGKWELNQLGTGTAGGVISNEFNIPVIGYGPGEEDQAHQINESVDFEKVIECIYGTAAIIHSLVGLPVFGWTSDEI